MATIGESSGQRKCADCGKWFKPKEPHHKTCFDCAQKARSSSNRGSGGGSGSRGQGGSSASRSDLTEKFRGYLKQLIEQGYFNERGYLRAELRVEDANMVAQVLARANVTSGQLRRFFTMARSLEQRLSYNPDFEALIPEIARFQPLAANLIGREQNFIQRRDLEVLRDFIDINAQKARENKEAFHKGFVPHFESVIAYFKYHKPKD
jgi:CRISPR type III-A-associated protein Csm2